MSYSLLITILPIILGSEYANNDGNDFCRYEKRAFTDLYNVCHYEKRDPIFGSGEELTTEKDPISKSGEEHIAEKDMIIKKRKPEAKILLPKEEEIVLNNENL
ncbi:uncharacterized protein LOC135926549 isoform X2 [Gordionus sp. m RMFG-2023]|uniref:uncharacterized protein LOC135926549 isoform X2 n=1 Tax=Gordionus sp. m RMFG-2023 TaxID=3053472 RepID=UPI0031FCBA2C